VLSCAKRENRSSSSTARVSVKCHGKPLSWEFSIFVFLLISCNFSESDPQTPHIRLNRCIVCETRNLRSGDQTFVNFPARRLVFGFGAIGSCSRAMLNYGFDLNQSTDPKSSATEIANLIID